MSADEQCAIEAAVQHAVAAQLALQQGDPETAAAHARAAVDVFGDDSADGANVLGLLSRAQCQLGDFDGAVQSAHTAVDAMAGLPGGGALDRIRAQAAQALGQVLLVRGDYVAARDCFAAAATSRVDRARRRRAVRGWHRETLPFLLVYLSTVRGLSLATAGLALSTLALASFVGNPLGASFADRFGARRTVIGGLLVAAAGAVALGLVREPWQAFGACAAVGLGVSIIWPAQDALLAAIAGREHRSSVFSVRHATLNTGLGIGALLAALIVDTTDPSTFTTLFLADAYATRPDGIPAAGLSLAFAANAITVVIAQLVILRLLRGHRRTTAITLACAAFAGAWAITIAAGQLGAGSAAQLAFAVALIVFTLAETLLSPTFAARQRHRARRVARPLQRHLDARLDDRFSPRTRDRRDRGGRRCRLRPVHRTDRDLRCVRDRRDAPVRTPASGSKPHRGRVTGDADWKFRV